MTDEIILRDVIEDDLPWFYEFQLDPEANHMAAFTAKDPGDRNAFMKHWHKIMGDEEITLKTILYRGQVAGSIVKYVMEGQAEVGYWIGKEYWGKGVATRGLTEFLNVIRERPLYAHVARDNLASIRVLEKCGFTLFGEGRGFANARGEEVEEYVMKLGGEPRAENKRVIN